MSADFLLVLALAGFAVVAVVPTIILPLIIAPKRPSAVKTAPFECGQIPVGEGRVHFMMQYYAYLLMFVVFDVIAMFLYAWGVSSVGVGLPATLIIVAFMAIMFVPMGYALHLAARRDIW
ncbi:MAG: NADH-quinone oxidoreductase subunit A [Thaumarchaeota archaeon]|nr:NADH-quinone oxidoreductase subunit A [Nitrososphaerota archaeon]